VTAARSDEPESGRPKEASEHTRRLHGAALAELPFEDSEDFEDAQRGLIAAEPSLVLRDEKGRAVWDMDAYRFLADEGHASEPGEGGVDRPWEDRGEGAPETVHPSLWRLARLNALHGLFEVLPGVYQVRGYDLSNVTFVEGEQGVIVIDPLISSECAQAALALYRRHRGERPVTAVIYSHSHVDHFGGVKGVVSQETVKAGDVAVWAPEGFLEHAVSENVLAGTAMTRRASYMFAPGLPRGPHGQIDAGIGKTTSSGTVTLIAPTHEVTATGQEETIDGVRFVFQLVPESEAPVEMNFHLPELRALGVPENATHCLHNVLTPRGALVRDALRWSKYLGETVELFGADSEAMFAQHHWPRWGKERIVAFLEGHRDLYRYIHDQTLRLANRGLTPAEIAAEIELPPSLARTWACRGYYGTVSYNARAVYQRYLGVFDGHPAHLDPLPPTQTANRYVELAGGLPALLDHARRALEEGDYRWAAEILTHAVFADPDPAEADRADPDRAEDERADPDRAEARELQARAFEQLGYQAESAVWRNLYLVGARELREGPPPAKGAGAGRAGRAASADVARALSIEQLWDALGARLDGPRAWDAKLALAWEFTDVEERWTVSVRNGALSAVKGRLAPDADATVTLTRAAFDQILLGEGDTAQLFASGAIAIDGDGAKLGELFGLLDEGDPSFAIVTP
jgi:alkyl sulfatase BDS1-like metallo-beta-lactamase superfamily hydrolase